MKLKQFTDNGNVQAVNQYSISDIIRNPDNQNWSSHHRDSTRYVNNSSTEYTSNFFSNPIDNTDGLNNEDSEKGWLTVNVNHGLVCNRQYRLDTAEYEGFETRFNKSDSANLEGVTESFLTSSESILGNCNVSTQSTPNDEERAFENSDTEEASDKQISLPVPRGIVNPNYPGFQHLAHTLQDYSSNIENYYHSENDMTDDDLDVEITDASYELEPKNNEMSIDFSNINNNNNNNEITIHKNTETDEIYQIEEYTNSQAKTDIPDLLKAISKNNNVDSSYFDLNCSDTDIEKNFDTKDIIGDFNKEIEDEIKQVLNYNINIQDDIEELKKEIKDNFTIPIENTINNISDVVNHVIKKLVKNECDSNNHITTDECVDTQILNKENIDEQNKSNALKEMHLSRPTFLLLDNNIDDKITDAILSDAKDEINIFDREFDTEKLSNNVHQTIKQLSTELRKIIPKLDELREREKFFSVNKNTNEPFSVITDGNCNQIASTSKNFKPTNPKVEKALSRNAKENNVATSIRTTGYRVRTNARISRDRQSEFIGINFVQNAHNSSVQSKEECELGSFDVYNIETALPKLDIDTIESHLKAAKEAERRKRNDREEIRKRLAMGADSEDYYSLGHTDRPGKKPSLQSRLQSDNESQASDVERNISSNNKNLSKSSIFSKSNYSLNNHPYQTRPLSVNITKHDKISTVQSVAKLRPSSLSLKSTKSKSTHSLGHIELKESDFYALQATLQTEARIALAQAKEMARIQMERERRGRAASPVTEMLRCSMRKAHAPLAADRRRVSRHLLTGVNIAQLQVIVNELHSQIESLNEGLVKLLMNRDELHMSQDSMLVDIEDLTRYLGVKEQSKKTKGTNKSAVRRLTSFVQK